MAIPAEKLGLIKKSDSGQYYDRIRDAIVFPICNANGTPLGFGARPFSGKPKYFNSSSSEIYDKSATLLGLNLAKKSIRIQKCAILVEGNFDVISMHRAGCTNTVATCGTALTADHCKQLKKHCKTVILMRDGDDAGMKAAKKDFELLMAHGFLVKIFQLTDGQDPDDFVREHMYMNPNENFADLKTEITA
jgi:DNA primase